MGCERDLLRYGFLSAATSFLEMPIQEALISDNYIIRIFAILDRRVGRRTLQKIKDREEDQNLPAWVKRFYGLRLNVEAKQGDAFP